MIDQVNYPVHYGLFMEKRQKPSLHNDWIDPEALFIVDRLQKAGFPTFLVGGCVRDLLAEIHPKDYDIATSASPEQVRKLIRGAYIIGRRFPLVLIKRGHRQFEVATFRRNASPEELESNENSFIDNYYGTPEEDACRRDFSINGLFYDPVQKELIDYVDGIKDIDHGLIRMIGEPNLRLKEDPIRILRAIRLSHKLKFSIEETLRLAIEKQNQELSHSILPRKREEYFKLMRLEDPSLAFRELHDLNILKFILPTLSTYWDKKENAEVFCHYLSQTHEYIPDPTNTTMLMVPLLLAFNEILDLKATPTNSEVIKANFDQLDIFLKAEWGLFKAEQQSLFEALDVLHQMNSIEQILKRGPRRLKNFFSRPSIQLSLLMAKVTNTLSGEHWLKINTLLFNKN